jgi:hypothetical protein
MAESPQRSLKQSPERSLERSLVRRILARDDLLLLARDAEEAVGIVREREGLARSVTSELNLFLVALRHHQGLVQSSDSWAIRSQALAYAGAIIRFCRVAGIELDGSHALEPEHLYDQARRELSVHGHAADGEPAAKDLTLDVLVTYQAIRDLRLAGKHDRARELAAQPDTYFFGSGAEPYRGHYQYEMGASLIMEGQAAQVWAALGETEQRYWRSTRAAEFSTRHRFDYIIGIAALAQGDATGAAARLADARNHLSRTRSQDYHDVQELSVTLALAECVAANPAQESVRRAVELAGDALTVAERIRSRWRVVARSRTPLSVTFRRVYGDIALLAARMPGAEAAKLGLRAGLSAKQTGFASRMREGSRLMSDHLSGLIEDIVRVEERSEQGPTVGGTTREAELASLHKQLEDAVSPMLADTVLPAPTDVTRIIETVGDRYAIDFVELPDTLSAANTWFRTLIEPGGLVSFERFEPKETFEEFFFDRGEQTKWLDRLPETMYGSGPDWLRLAVEILPVRLFERARRAGRGEPIELIISAHSRLSLLPWAALTIDDAGTRLVERAVIVQSPVLTCLSYQQIPPVSGSALVRLVSSIEGGVTIRQESMAWDMDVSAQGRVLSRCDVTSDTSYVNLTGSFRDALADPATGWQFVHIASHGGGIGLEQYLLLPERLTAAAALTLPWPESVLMASCHVGRLVNPEDAEPLSFVMALLTGGSRCVVAGIDEIPDTSTGRLAAGIIDQVRAGNGTVRLDVALRQAQLTRLGGAVHTWALLNAYAR